MRRVHLAATALLSFAAALLGIYAVNRSIEWAASRKRVELYRGVDDMQEFVDEPLFDLSPDGWYRTTPYAEESMVAGRFRGRKGDAWRAFVLGESFAMGTPYAMQGPGRDRPGGIPSFLSADLEALAPKRPIEVINAAAGAQNSHRVRLIADQALELSPDLLVVATCNNEGVLDPGIVTETVHRIAGVRLIRRLIAPPVDPSRRSDFTPQDPDTVRVRREFRANVHAILEGAARKNARVLLATLPVNLRYDGGMAGHVLPGGPPSGSASACVARGASLLAQGLAGDAEAALRSCEDVEALRALGLLEYDRGSYGEANRHLTQYVELVPRNRCRPSFNQDIRDEAALFPNARLVDLEKEARLLAPHGIPGPELFIDYCHMTWWGYKSMEEAMLKVLEREDWLPGKGGRLPSRETLRKRFNLPEGPARRSRPRP